MSSHHVVREKQEPALLVLGLDAFPDDFLGQLLEWSPTVIATPDTAEKLNAFGIKIDWIIADGEEPDIQSDVKMMSAGNDNLTDAALKYLTTFEYGAVNIITDDLNIADFEPFANQINLVIFHQQQRIYPVTSGFSKWKPKDDVIKVLSAPSNIEVNGLEITGANTYKTTSDGIFSLKFHQPFLFIAEEL